MIKNNKDRIVLTVLMVTSAFTLLLPSTLTDISRITADSSHCGPAIIEGEPVTLYSHGLLCNKWVGHLLHCDAFFRSPNAYIKGPMISFSYRDWLSPLSTCVGQEDDLDQLHSFCHKHQNVILVGCSRGAAAIVNYLGINKPNNIIAAIIESPFDHSRNAIKSIAHQINIQKKSVIDSISAALAPNHNQEGIQPIDHVAQIDHSIPVLFIGTTKDKITPVQGCIELYKTLRSAGHPSVHIFIADHGSHGLITLSSDGKIMRNVIHAFYKQYGLPHEAAWAQAGQERFSQCQPSFKE